MVVTNIFKDFEPPSKKFLATRLYLELREEYNFILKFNLDLLICEITYSRM